jgi:hypothetical protein
MIWPVALGNETTNRRNILSYYTQTPYTKRSFHCVLKSNSFILLITSAVMMLTFPLKDFKVDSVTRPYRCAIQHSN